MHNIIPIGKSLVGIELIRFQRRDAVWCIDAAVDALFVAMAILVHGRHLGIIGQATRSCQGHTAGARALAATFLDDLAMDAHLLAVVTGLEGDVHALDPAREIGEVLGGEAIGRALHGKAEVANELLLWSVSREMLEAREGILIELRLGKGEVDVVGARGQVGEALMRRVGSIVEVEEFVHLVDGGHSEGVDPPAPSDG